MATYTLGSGFAAHAKTLAAGVVDVVDFGRNIDLVEVVVESGTAPVYFTVDGSTPTVAGSRTWAAFVGQGVRLPVPEEVATTVRLISAASAVYSVSEA